VIALFAFLPAYAQQDTAGKAQPQNPAASKADTKDLKASEAPGTTEVFVTRTGKKYHRETCQHLSKSKIPMTLSDAVAKGYGPCAVCNPPPLPGAAANAPATAAQGPPQSSPTSATKRQEGTPAEKVGAAAQAASKEAGAADQVFVTNTGKKYHRAGCRYLSKSQIPISRSDAQARGYGACSVCSP
jgi:hypothetical protein